MIVIKIVLIFIMLLVFSVLAFSKKYKLCSKILTIISFFIVAYFISFPTHADIIAHAFGITSGTNLALYLSVSILFLISASLYVRIRRHDRYFTHIIRNRAIEKHYYNASNRDEN